VCSNPDFISYDVESIRWEGRNKELYSKLGENRSKHSFLPNFVVYKVVVYLLIVFFKIILKFQTF